MFGSIAYRKRETVRSWREPMIPNFRADSSYPKAQFGIHASQGALAKSHWNRVA